MVMLASIEGEGERPNISMRIKQERDNPHMILKHKRERDRETNEAKLNG